MNKAILITMLLVLPFLGINSVYLYKLTMELQEANKRIQQVENSVERVREGIVILRKAAEGELREPAEDLVREMKEKITELDLDSYLDEVAITIKKTGDAEQPSGGDSDQANDGLIGTPHE